MVVKVSKSAEHGCGWGVGSICILVAGHDKFDGLPELEVPGFLFDVCGAYFEMGLECEVEGTVK